MNLSQMLARKLSRTDLGRSRVEKGNIKGRKRKYQGCDYAHPSLFLPNEENLQRAAVW